MSDVERDNTSYIRDDYEGPVTYRYYTLGSSHPLRVMLNARGHALGVEGPDKGRLVFKALLLRLADSPDTEEIDRRTFERMCMEVTSLDVSSTYGKRVSSAP